jgi:hypothetical protein
MGGGVVLRTVGINYFLGWRFLHTLREWISGFYDRLRQRPSSLFMLFGCSSISGLPDQPIHVSGFDGQDLGVLELDTMSPADAVFSYCRFLWMSQTNVSVVLLDPGINGMVSLPNVNLTTFAGYVVHAWSFQFQVIFHGPKETSNFSRREAHRLDVVPGQHTADAIEGHIDKGKKGNRSGLLRSGRNSLLWIESPSDLPVTVAVPLESVLEKLQLIMKTFVITQGFVPMYQRGKHSLFVGRVVVRVGMEIEVGVSGFMVDSMVQ